MRLRATEPGRHTRCPGLAPARHVPYPDRMEALTPWLAPARPGLSRRLRSRQAEPLAAVEALETLDRLEKAGIANQTGAGDVGVGDWHGSVRNKRAFWPNSGRVRVRPGRTWCRVRPLAARLFGLVTARGHPPVASLGTPGTGVSLARPAVDSACSPCRSSSTGSAGHPARSLTAPSAIVSTVLYRTVTAGATDAGLGFGREEREAGQGVGLAE